MSGRTYGPWAIHDIIQGTRPGTDFMRNLKRFALPFLCAGLAGVVAGCSGLPDDYDGRVRVLHADEYRDWAATGKTFVILDVRTESEFRDTHRAPGAVLQTWSFDNKKRSVNEAFVAAVSDRYDRGETIILLCSLGMRASQAAWTLQEVSGFRDLHVYAGGYEGHHMDGYPSGPGWIADGLPVEH